MWDSSTWLYDIDNISWCADASFKESLPGQVCAPAVFKCVRDFEQNQQMMEKSHSYYSYFFYEFSPDHFNEQFFKVNINPKAVVKEENTNIVQVEGSSGRKIVLGLMSKSECPWRSDTSSPKFKPASIGGTDERKGKIVDYYAQLDSCHENDSMARNKVRNALRLFQAVSRKLLQEAEAKAKSNEKERRRFDLQAEKILKEKGNYVNEGDKILGSVPGVVVGDEFQYRIELNVIGFHRQIQGGIYYVKQKNKVLATSIVASGGYSDELDNTDVLIYTGQGGNVM
ncbi:histone-lysine N-methyltransferase H3 lysine-9 specific SUVH6-like protein, partial [Trifolium pratense]